MAAKYFNFVDGQRLPGDRVKEFLMNQAVIQCENQTEITGSGIELFGARVAVNLEDGQLWTYTPDIEAWAPAQNTLDLDLLDARYYTKIAANGIFISETTADARYLTEVTARGIFLTQTDATTTYYTKLQADGLFLSQTTADGRYYTKLQADGLFMTQTTSDARYYTKLQADGLYLGKVEAGNTYVTQVSAGQIYLSKTDAQNTYITQINAGTLFVSKGGAAGDINANNTTIDGGKITTNSINVNRLVAGTLTGFRIQTSSSGQRVVISESSNSISWWDSSGIERGRITGGSSLNIESSGNGIALQVDGVGTVFSVNGSGVALAPGRNFNSNLPVSGNITATGTVSSSGVTLGQSVTASNGGGTFGGTLSVGGTSSMTGLLTTNGGIRMLNFSGQTATTATINGTGFIVRTTSSERYKQDINNLVIDYNDVINLQPKTFKRIEEVEEFGDDASTYAGFIAEDLAGTSLDQFVFYSHDEQGNLRPEGIQYEQLSAALIVAIKEQDSRLNALEARITALEAQ
jgi:hypothetical protein